MSPLYFIALPGLVALALALGIARERATWLLVGTALAPTDPAVVFSVLGRREVAGRTGTLLEGESGANDPVGIALMVSLLTVSAAGVSGGSAVVGGVGSFLVQMMVGAAGASPVGGA